MADSQPRIGCFSDQFVDATDVHTKHLCRKVRLVTYDEHHQLATRVIGIT